MRETPAIIASALPGKRVDAQRAGITMTAFMKASDHSLTRRLTIVVIAIFAFVAAFDRLYLLYAHKFIDITDDYKNIEPTGSAWNIVRAWRDDLLVRDPPAASMSSPMLIGRPPIGRWNFLSSRAREFTAPPVRVIAPRAAFRFKTAIPE